MKVKSYIPGKLFIQLVRCIELLGNEYKTLNFTLDVYLNRDKLEAEIIKRPVINDEVYKQILNGKVQPPGLIIPDKKLIKFFLFNLDDIENENQRKLELVANLFHEMRHAWQFNVTPKFFFQPSIIVKLS